MTWDRDYQEEPRPMSDQELDDESFELTLDEPEKVCPFCLGQVTDVDEDGTGHCGRCKELVAPEAPMTLLGECLLRA